MTDMHSHILPGVDDGSRNLEESIAMLRAEAAQGIGHVIATPHFDARYDDPERFLARREGAAEALRREMEKYPELPRISLGAEVRYFRGISDWDDLSRLTVGGKRAVLIEMMPQPWPESALQELSDIWHKQGLVPVIAHIERYIGPFGSRKLMTRLEKMPVKIQASASFFLERRTALQAVRMLKHGRIHLLGSDCHNMTTRKPDLGEAIRRIQRNLGPIALERIGRYEKQILEE